MEGEINPEEVWGKYFRIPMVEGGGSGRGFGFDNLNLPRRWEETEFNDYFKSSFEHDAHNIAGRFGLTIHHITWDKETGILISVDVNEGNACGIYLERDSVSSNSGRYAGHNIDTLTQAHVLFSIVARFINEVLDRIYGSSR